MKALEDLITYTEGHAAALTLRSAHGEDVEAWTAEALSHSAHGETIDEAAANLLETLEAVPVPEAPVDATE